MIRDIFRFPSLFLLLLVGLYTLHPALSGQDSPQAAKKDQNTGTALPMLKRSFIGIELGQSLDEFHQQVSRQENSQGGQQGGTLPDSYYYFLYDLYTSEIEEGGGQETLVEVKGNGFIEKGLFQFAVSGEESEPKLVAITIFLDQQWSSYDQFFQKLTSDYGNPNVLSPQRSIWENGETIVTLEKQLRYKIIDRQYLDGLKNRDQQELDLYQYNYQEFLKKF